MKETVHERFIRVTDNRMERIRQLMRGNSPCPCGSGKKFKRCHMKGGE